MSTDNDPIVNDPAVQMLHTAVKGMRAESFKNSDQLTLGELLLKLKAIPDNDDGDKGISFDFGSAVPTTFDSWRGSYDELALGYKLTSYDAPDGNSGEYPPVKLKDFIKEAEATLGKTLTGWKGGDFTMTKNTPVWVDNPGNANNTAIVDVTDLGWSVVINTAHREY